MPIKSFKEVYEELRNKKFKPLSPNALGNDGEFEHWLHRNIKNPIIKWTKRCTNRDKLYKKLKHLGRV